MKAIVLSLCLFYCFTATAMTDCQEQQQSQLKYSKCLDQQLTQAERALETWENSHRLKLEEMAQRTGRDDPLRLFNRSRTEFKQFSSDHCRWQFLALIPDSDTGATLFKECMIKQLNQQIELLQIVQYPPG